MAAVFMMSPLWASDSSVCSPRHRGGRRFALLISRSVGWIKDVSLLVFKPFSDSTHTASSLRTSDEGGSNMGGCRVSAAPPAAWIKQTPREHELPAPPDLGCGDHMQTATPYVDPVIGAVLMTLGVYELELGRTDVDRGARAKDVRDTRAQYSRQSAPGSMTHEWAHQ